MAAQAGEIHWLATALEAYDGRSATEATKEPPASKRGRSGSEMLDEKVGRAGIELNDSAVPQMAFNIRLMVAALPSTTYSFAPEGMVQNKSGEGCYAR